MGFCLFTITQRVVGSVNELDFPLKWRLHWLLSRHRMLIHRQARSLHRIPNYYREPLTAKQFCQVKVY